VLDVRQLVAGYTKEVDILRGVDVTVHTGEIVALVGPNGAGKSTLVKSVLGLLRPRDGEIRLHGQSIRGLPPHVVVRRGIGYVAQRLNVFASLTVHENVLLAARLVEKRERVGRTAEMYDLFPALAAKRSQVAGTLSGGERQMVAFARALLPRPELLVLDEPSAGLAPRMLDLVFETTVRLNNAGVTIVLVEQNARRALAIASRGYVLDAGATSFHDTGANLLTNPRVIDLYLGGTQ
jgi:ABC-type branched-subunit amino acid transport system ATPase component